jgi:hypothetical protein
LKDSHIEIPNAPISRTPHFLHEGARLIWRHAFRLNSVRTQEFLEVLFDRVIIEIVIRAPTVALST